MIRLNQLFNKEPKEHHSDYFVFIILFFIFLVIFSNNRKKEPEYEIIQESAHTTSYDGELPSITDGFPDENSFTELSVPTQFNKIGDDYFIVDCYNNQLLTTRDLSLPVEKWSVVTSLLNKPHTIAGDGQVYLLDNTDDNEILVFEKKEDSFTHTQTFEEIGDRPHYVIYDTDDKAFYTLSSMTGEMYIFRRHKDSSDVFLSEIRTVPELKDVYVRSFTIIGDDLYLVSGNAFVLRLDKHTFEIKERFPVPNQFVGMVQITKIQDYFYITISTDKSGNQDYATMIRVKELTDLWEENYQEVYSLFTNKKGTPYYITEIDGTYYLANHRTAPGIFSFSVTDNEITNIRELY